MFSVPSASSRVEQMAALALVDRRQDRLELAQREGEVGEDRVVHGPARGRGRAQQPAVLGQQDGGALEAERLADPGADGLQDAGAPALLAGQQREAEQAIERAAMARVALGVGGLLDGQRGDLGQRDEAIAVLVVELVPVERLVDGDDPEHVAVAAAHHGEQGAGRRRRARAGRRRRSKRAARCGAHCSQLDVLPSSARRASSGPWTVEASKSSQAGRCRLMVTERWPSALGDHGRDAVQREDEIVARPDAAGGLQRSSQGGDQGQGR